MRTGRERIPLLSGGEPLKLDEIATFAVRRAMIRVSNVALQTLQSVPVELIPAPGPGKVVSISTVMLQYNYGTTPWGVTGGAIVARGNDMNTDLTGNQLQPDFTQTNSQIDQGPGFQATGPGSFNSPENQPVLLTQAADLGPDGDGSLQINIFYLIFDVLPE